MELQHMSHKEQREQIKKDIAEFLANGGVIEVIEPNKAEEHQSVGGR